MNSTGKGKLFIVGTPIGNLKDISLRALEVLKEVDLIVSEDTRRTRKLTSYYDIHRPLISYNDHSPPQREREIIEKIREGKKVAFVTDAGMPGFSDPGFRLIVKAIKENLELTVIPGASAILASLLLSGLPPYPFAFLGFPPPRGSKRKEFFEKYKDLPFTRVLFESPRRILKTIEDISKNWNDPFLCVARELTKLFEETIRGKASYVLTLMEEREESQQGEITIVVEGQKESRRETSPDLEEEIKSLLSSKNPPPLPKLTKALSKKYGLPRSEVYKRALNIKERLT